MNDAMKRAIEEAVKVAWLQEKQPIMNIFNDEPMSWTKEQIESLFFLIFQGGFVKGFAWCARGGQNVPSSERP